MRRWALLSLTLLVGCGEIAPDAIFGALNPVEAQATRIEPLPAFGAILDKSTVPVRYDEGFSTKGALLGGADLRPIQSPIKNQGGMGACTGFAIASLREFLLGRHQQVQLSPLFMYRRELERSGVPLNEKALDAGAYIRVGMQILKEEGIPPETYAPFATGREAYDRTILTDILTAFPDRQAFGAARDFRVKNVMPVTTLRDFKYQLSTGHAVVFGFAVFESIRQAGKTGIVPEPGGRMVGGHAVLAVGFNDHKQQIIFKNSWSPMWGDQGYGYLPYSYVKKGLVGDAWTAI